MIGASERARRAQRWFAVAVAAAGCAEEPTDEAAAVEAMVLETCAPSDEGETDEADPVCRCAYEALLEEYGSEELARLDALLRHDDGALPPEAQRLVLDCAFDIVVPDIPPVPTTEPDPATEPDPTTTTTTGEPDRDGTTTTTGGPDRDGTTTTATTDG